MDTCAVYFNDMWAILYYTPPPQTQREISNSEFVTNENELGLGEGLFQGINKMIFGWDMSDNNLFALHFFSYEKEIKFNVFGSRMHY